VMEILSMSGIECFRELNEVCAPWNTAVLVEMNTTNPTVGSDIVDAMNAVVANLHKIRMFCNDLLKKKSVIFSCTVRVFDANFNSVSSKFSLKSVGGVLSE